MKAQACRFITIEEHERASVILKSDQKWEDGIAFMTESGFDGGSVDFIVNANRKILSQRDIYSWPCRVDRCAILILNIHKVKE